MKRALIAIASVGILAPTAWVIGANAQTIWLSSSRLWSFSNV
jgi:hypothetical protein